jgi:ABC-type uncharacterized transport system YnjBCD substrate-binding protein
MKNTHTSNLIQQSQLNKLKLARTQIYLTALHQTTLARMAKEQACAKSELIRQALDIFIATEAQQASVQRSERNAQRAEALGLLSGMWADRADMADPSGHIRSLRNESRI